MAHHKRINHFYIIRDFGRYAVMGWRDEPGYPISYTRYGAYRLLWMARRRRDLLRRNYPA